jgi:tRNA (Thr-GGU) A37 N-methylase/xanthine/CO dehydrogenase XdhC/CoxF family maturation factor
VEEVVRPALEDLKSFDYLWVVSWLDRPDELLDDPLRVDPLLRLDGRRVSQFATRCPIRHNPIGFSLSELVAVDVENGVLEVRGLDLADGTPVLDLKPYVPAFDRPQGGVPIAAGWYDEDQLEAPLPIEAARSEAMEAAEGWIGASTPFVVIRPLGQHGPGIRAGGEFCVASPTALGGEILGGAVRPGEILAMAGGALSDPGAARAQLSVDTEWGARHALGLGRKVTVLVTPGLEIPAEWWARLGGGAPVALAVALDGEQRATVFEPGKAFGPLGDVDPARRAAAQLLDLRYESGRVLDDIVPPVAVQTYLPTPRLVLAGWPALASVIAEIARPQGWRCVKAASPDEAVTLTRRLTRFDAVVVLGHGRTLDEPVLEAALRPDGPGFVGATGSARVAEGRRRRLVARGVDPADVACLRSPVGLPIGGRSAPEVALSIVAELQEYRYGT